MLRFAISMYSAVLDINGCSQHARASGSAHKRPQMETGSKNCVLRSRASCSFFRSLHVVQGCEGNDRMQRLDVRFLHLGWCVWMNLLDRMSLPSCHLLKTEKGIVPLVCDFGDKRFNARNLKGSERGGANGRLRLVLCVSHFFDIRHVCPISILLPSKGTLVPNQWRFKGAVHGVSLNCHTL
jgi:hypothetical protein